MTLPPVVSDPEVCPWNAFGHDWRRGESVLGWVLSWLGLTDRYPVEVCRYCGGRRP